MTTAGSMISTANFPPGSTGRMTVSLWFKPTGVVSIVFSIGATNELKLWFSAAYTLTVNGANCFGPLINIIPNQWNFVAIAADYSGYYGNFVYVNIQLGTTGPANAYYCAVSPLSLPGLSIFPHQIRIGPFFGFIKYFSLIFGFDIETGTLKVSPFIF